MNSQRSLSVFQSYSGGVYNILDETVLALCKVLQVNQSSGHRFDCTLFESRF